MNFNLKRRRQKPEKQSQYFREFLHMCRETMPQEELYDPCEGCGEMLRYGDEYEHFFKCQKLRELIKRECLDCNRS